MDEVGFKRDEPTEGRKDQRRLTLSIDERLAEGREMESRIWIISKQQQVRKRERKWCGAVVRLERTVVQL